MDESLKVILGKHWPTLVRYINPTHELIDVLVEDKVLPSAMIDDIQRGATRREKNEILLKSIKLRGNTSYRKFRDVMIKCGQIFIADLLFEEEGAMTFLEESDFTGFPALKLSLSPTVLKQFVLFLDAKVRARVLRNEWKTDSTKRLEHLQTRTEDDKSYTQEIMSSVAKDEKIKQLCAEINVKNDIIRSLSIDINILNSEVDTFTERYRVSSKYDVAKTQSPPTTEPSHDDNKTASPVNSTPSTPRNGQLRGSGQKSGTTTPDSCTAPTPRDTAASLVNVPMRFSFFDKALTVVNNKLSSILGLSVSSAGEITRIDVIQARALQIQELVAQLEEQLRLANKDRETAITLLMPDSQQKFSSAVAGVQRYLLQEQRHRFALLKDIDRLSRKLRGITHPTSNSGLHALRQSAVTGKPSAEIVDYRFLSNHIALVEADAVHIHKKLNWKNEDMKGLQSELSQLRNNTANVPQQV